MCFSVVSSKCVTLFLWKAYLNSKNLYKPWSYGFGVLLFVYFWDRVSHNLGCSQAVANADLEQISLTPEECHHGQLNLWLINSEFMPVPGSLPEAPLPSQPCHSCLCLVKFGHMGEATRGHMISCDLPGYLKVSHENLEVKSLRERSL